MQSTSYFYDNYQTTLYAPKRELASYSQTDRPAYTFTTTIGKFISRHTEALIHNVAVRSLYSQLIEHSLTGARNCLITN